MSKHLIVLGALTLSGCSLLSPCPHRYPGAPGRCQPARLLHRVQQHDGLLPAGQPDLPAGLQGDRSPPADALQHPVSGGSYDEDKKVYKAAKPYRVANTVHSLTIQCPVDMGITRADPRLAAGTGNPNPGRPLSCLTENEPLMSPRISLLGSILLSGCALLPAPATVRELPPPIPPSNASRSSAARQRSASNRRS